MRIDVDLAIEITLRLIMRFEGYSSKPYLCPAGVPTIGYGSTYYPDGRRVKLTDPEITQQFAIDMLMNQVWTEFLPAVIRLCPNLETPEQIAALVDFAFNLGISRLKSSTLRLRVNSGRWEAAKDELRKWVYAAGKKLQGLVLRREAEVALI